MERSLGDKGDGKTEREDMGGESSTRVERTQKLKQKVSQSERFVEELTDLMCIDGVRNESRVRGDGKKSIGSKGAMEDKKKLEKQGDREKGMYKANKTWNRRILEVRRRRPVVEGDQEERKSVGEG